ncbi:CHAT domain-containing protein [Kocuria sp. CPCC 205268]|uniref:CHAT domain-containing protein n=1 Tax=Kocuria oxytropis TaxID=3058913 RepID=UPI0034D47DB9
MTVLEISVDRAGQPGLYDVDIIQSPVGEVSATVSIDCEHLMQSRDQWQQALLASTASTRRIIAGPETAIQGVGQALYEALLGHPELASRYRSSLDVAAEHGESLRLVLRLSAPELTPLPWEAMYDPVTGTYVSRSEPLVRHVPVASAPRPLRVEHPVRVLGIIASPKGMPVLDVEAEEQYLTSALSVPIRQGRIELEWIRHATWQRIQDTLLSDQWHIVHFIGHGDFDARADEGVLALEGEDGRVSLVEASRFADLLHEARPMPRLVVLNSCLSALSGSADLFSGTASALVRGGVSAVVAMQFEITDPAAAAFARGFYAAVAAGRPVDQAVRSGRVAILGMNGHTLEWITPVLYIRGQETRLFSLRKPRKPAVAAGALPTDHKDGAENPSATVSPPGVLSVPISLSSTSPSSSTPETGIASEGEDDLEPWYEEFPESAIPTVPAVTHYTLDELDLSDDGGQHQLPYEKYSIEPDGFLDNEPTQFTAAQAPVSSTSKSSPATGRNRFRRPWFWLVALLVLLLIAGLLWLFLLWRPEPTPDEAPAVVPAPSPEITSAGPMDTTVPVFASQYEGRPVEEVEQELTDLGFVIQRQSQPSDEPPGTVLS